MTVPTTPAPLLDAVRRVCHEILRSTRPDLDPGLHRTGHDVLAGLGEPLRLAVAGRVKAGKSTLVNALVGRMVAPTRAGECTRVVTWYRYGSPDRAEIVRRDGARIPLAFTGRLPEELGMPVREIDHLEVHLQSGTLRHLTLIDTPGLATTNTGHEESTRRALLGGVDTDPRTGAPDAPPAPDPADGPAAASVRATSQADAVLYLFRDAERRHEVDFLRDLQDSFGTLGPSATTVAGLLSHADLAGGDPWGGTDPFAVAAAQARRLAGERSAELGAVVPVAGLLAQTARTGRLREDDARRLAALAAVDPVLLQLAGQGTLPPGVDQAGFDALLALLGPHGVVAGRSRAGRGAGELIGWLEDVSGIRAVEELIHRQFLRRAHALKADRALIRLERAATGPGRGIVQAIVEAARQSPELHPIRQLRALGLLMRAAPGSPLRAELTHLVDAGSDTEMLGAPPGTAPQQLVAAARDAGARAQARVGFATSPAEAEAARVVARSYLLLARRQEPATAGRGPW
ncbi:dynamin family protein [Nakamurella deserti]|uniref:dynamin family protein n=1 Tax=Nakamurella deserti TaxID=2164074 RepID=UPI001478CAF6|nr:dynamin family protein [Nakamurella deserti]